MVTIDVSKGELEAGKLNAENFAVAVHAVKEDGFVVLANVVDLAHIAALRDKMTDDVTKILARPDAPFNWNTGNIQQEPPPLLPYLFRDVLVNDLVIHVTAEVLGPRPYSNFYSGNTALKSTQRQPVHGDTGHLWRNMETAAPAHTLVVNVPLVDMSAENGATELWPGTHKDTIISIYDPIELTEEHLSAWREKSPPIQPNVKAGSVLIRDMRLWHAGMPNLTNIPRPMIAMIHSASFLGGQGKMKFPKGSEAIFEHPELRSLVEFVDGEIDYIKQVQGYKADEAK